ncbi:MAG TPA: hypothetical protein VJ553_03240 [Candidatus Paceibacterota bacterium]|nr:hypothetical protein [Candidatus Paceibacterota bacterium]
MQIPDLINGTFEMLGGVATYMNCWQLHKDKEVKGVIWWLTAFYITWGVWNLYYYPHLDQWLSLYGGLVIVSGNVVWILQVVWYRWIRPRNRT